MTYKPFSVVVVPFPFTDSRKDKKRPALVLSSEEHQTYSGHITLCMITSALHNPWLDDHGIIDKEHAGLSVDCVVRQKIFTIDSRLIVKQIGKFSINDTNQVLKVLKKHLSFQE